MPRHARRCHAANLTVPQSDATPRVRALHSYGALQLTCAAADGATPTGERNCCKSAATASHYLSVPTSLERSLGRKLLHSPLPGERREHAFSGGLNGMASRQFCRSVSSATPSSTSSSSSLSTTTPRRSSMCRCCSRLPQPANFAKVEDMLFEVFRCEETDSIDSIAIAQFLKVRMQRFRMIHRIQGLFLYEEKACMLGI